MKKLTGSLTLYRIQAFSQSEILELLDFDTIQGIQQKDPHPFFQAYSIAHEGVSQPKILDDEQKPICWGRRAIQSLKNLVLKGIKLFKGHNKDNSTKNRESIGEVVGNIEKEIDGKLNNVEITYHTPEQVEEAKQYDVCSQEGSWNF